MKQTRASLGGSPPSGSLGFERCLVRLVVGCPASYSLLAADLKTDSPVRVGPGDSSLDQV